MLLSDSPLTIFHSIKFMLIILLCSGETPLTVVSAIITTFVTVGFVFDEYFATKKLQRALQTKRSRNEETMLGAPRLEADWGTIAYERLFASELSNSNADEENWRKRKRRERKRCRKPTDELELPASTRFVYVLSSLRVAEWIIEQIKSNPAAQCFTSTSNLSRLIIVFNYCLGN